MKIYMSLLEDGVIEGWGSARGMDSQIEVEIPDTHEFLNDIPIFYRYLDGEFIKDDTLVLKRRKDRKLQELNRICSSTIMGRFSHEVEGVTYLFSNDMEAQSNFDKADRAFEKGRITETTWTCYDEGGTVHRLTFNSETFEALYVKHLEHIQHNISKFRDTLMPRVLNATEGEIDSITWESEE